MSQFKFLNLDSKDSLYSSVQANNSYEFDRLSSTYAENSYNTSWNLRIPIVKPKRVWLKSVELPIGFCNIRSSNFSNTITLSSAVSNGTNYTVTIPDRIYSNIKTLLDTLNVAFANDHPSINVVFSINTDEINHGYVRITTTTPDKFAIGIIVKNSILASTILGFKIETDVHPYNYRVARGMYILNPDNYINLQIKNISSDNINNDGIPSSFKIPLDTINGTVLFNASNLGFDQFISINSVTLIDKIQIEITDRWGYSINSRGLDWSMTLAIEI